MPEESEATKEASPAEAEDVFHVWPENEQSFLLFAGLQRRWLVSAGLGGVVYLGLDAHWIKLLFGVQRVAPGERPRLLEELIQMEGAALKVLNRKHG